MDTQNHNQTHANRSLHPLAWVAGVAIVTFSVVGVSAIMGWIPTSNSGQGENPVLESKAGSGTAQTQPAKSRPPAARQTAPGQVAANAPAPVAAAARCAECGVIESVREVK